MLSANKAYFQGEAVLNGLFADLSPMKPNSSSKCGSQLSGAKPDTLINTRLSSQPEGNSEPDEPDVCLFLSRLIPETNFNFTVRRWFSRSPGNALRRVGLDLVRMNQSVMPQHAFSNKPQLSHANTHSVSGISPRPRNLWLMGTFDEKTPTWHSN